MFDKTHDSVLTEADVQATLEDVYRYVLMGPDGSMPTSIRI